MRVRVSSLLLVVTATACRHAAPQPAPAHAEDAAPKAPEARGPAWPTSPEPPAPEGFRWTTVHHETIHARLLVPLGVEPTLQHDGYGYPRVDVDVDGKVVVVQFDSGIGALAQTLAESPPKVYSLVAQKALVTDETIAARYVDSLGAARISGYAPGVKCLFEGYGATPESTLERIWTVCSSLRSPAPGAWRPATEEERAHGGMTDVPEGAWVEGALPSTPGAALRPGAFRARMYLGGLVVRGGVCPASFDALSKKEPSEAQVDVEHRSLEGGDVYVRSAIDAFDGRKYPGGTTIVASRAGRCCYADFVPWSKPPSAPKIDWAIALCDTFRSE